MSWRDRTLGIVLGLVIGIAAVTLFVLFGSGETIDAPSLDHDAVERQQPADDGGE